MIKHLLSIFLIAYTGTALSFDWEQKADFGGLARHRTTMLAIGNQIYAGLGHFNGAGPNILFEDWWQYDPATNAWTQKADYLGGPMYHSAGFTIGNKGYVGTGRNPAAQLVKTFFCYDPATNTWEQKANFPGVGRRGGVGFAIGDFGYIGTGSYYSDFYKYDPSNDTWSPVASMPTAGRISAVGFELDGYGYVGTGSTSGAQKDFWQYDPNTNQWTQKADVGSIPRQESSGFGVLGKGYILTGDNYSSGDNYSDMYEYDPINDTWTQLEDFPGTARRYLSSIAMGNVAYAGLGTSGTNFKDFWVYDPVASLIEKQLDLIEVKAYPNPAVDNITFDLEGLNIQDYSNLLIELYTIDGKVVKSTQVTIGENAMNLQNINAGVYYYNLCYKKNALKTGKIIIQ